MSKPLTLFPGHWAIEDPSRAAVIMATSGEVMRYDELERFANRLSHWFRKIGLQNGDHVAFCLENRIEFLAILWGCHYAGLYYTAISTRLNADETSYILNNCGAQVFIASPHVAEMATSAVPTTPDVAFRLSVGGDIERHGSLLDALTDMPDTPLPNRRETNDMLYSSGTTGRPKGVKVLSAGEPLGSGDNVTRLAQALFSFRQGSVYLSPGPLYHAAPLRFCRAALRTGGTVVVMERFDAEDALAAIEAHRVTTSQWVPTMFLRMLKLDQNVRGRYDLSSLECAIHAAAPCPVAAKEQMIAWWGPIIHEYYGGTEGNGLAYCNSEEWIAHKGTVGRAVSGTIHIIDDDGNELTAGEEGGVYFSGGGDFEYHNDPEKTAASRASDGKSTLGDIGRLDEDGYLHLTDRRAFMIISGGVNIYPQEAENVLSMHPQVLDAAVFGIPNDDFGEEVKAVVQPLHMPATAEQRLTLEEQLIAYCRQQLADVKCPRSIDFRAELPRHPTGKLYKRLLRDEYWPKKT